jgi:enoyl-CoA hydratase/carnithine racemase
MGSSAVDTTLLVSLQRGVLTLTLNRPERRNAIDPELRDALHGGDELVSPAPARASAMAMIDRGG